MPMPYDSDEIAAALVAAQRRWSFRYDRVNADDTIDGTEDVVECTVKHEDLADIKRTCEVTLSASSTFDQLTHRLRPYARLKMLDGDWQEWSLGTFYLQTSKRRRASAAGDATSPRTGYDATIVLQEDRVVDRHVVAAGSLYTTAVSSLLSGAGLSTAGVSAHTATLPGAMEWEPGTPKLKIINDLLAALNYRPVRMNANGIPIASAYVLPDAAPVLWQYVVDRTSVVRPGVDTELDLFSIPNTWIAYVSEPDRLPLRAIRINDDALDPLSTVGRGRSIVRVLDVSDVGQAATQDILIERVERASIEDRQQYETASFTTGLMPIHDSGDVVELDYGDGPLRFRETSWQVELRAGATMQHSARRVVSL